MNIAQYEYPGLHPEIVETTGAYFSMKKDFNNALNWYGQLLTIKPNDPFVLYNIARSYAQSGKMKDAWQYLSLSMQAGFRYGYVLDEDNAWASYRKDVRWKDLRKKYADKKYAEPVQFNN